MRFLVLALLLVPAHARADDELEVVHSFRGIDVVESANVVRYAAKGPNPWLDHASINLEVRDGKAHAIEIKKLALVFANGGCPKKPAKADLKTFAVTKHELFNWTDEDPIARGTASVRIPAAAKQRYSVKASFAGLLTTSACRFEVDLVIDRVRQRIELPISIRSYDRIGE